MARDTDPTSSGRRIVLRAALLVVPVLASAILAPRLLGNRGAGEAAPAPQTGFRPPSDGEIEAARQAEEKLAEAQRGWQRTSVIAPQDARSDASGESVRRFHGFGVSVESTPSAARVVVNGAEVGETPIVASVACAPGDPVRIEVQKPPRQSSRRVTICRADTLVELSVDLGR